MGLARGGFHMSGLGLVEPLQLQRALRLAPVITPTNPAQLPRGQSFNLIPWLVGATAPADRGNTSSRLHDYYYTPQVARTW